MKHLKKFSILWLVITLVVVFNFPLRPAQAANLTSVSDTLNTLAQNTDANHEIYFVTPTGVESSTDTITIDFTDFTTTGVLFSDVDLAVDADDGACDGSWTEKTIAASAAAGTWGYALASDVITLTPPTDAGAGEITAGRCVQVQIGTNAAGPGVNQITNPNDTSTHVIEIDGVFGDDGKFALDFVADDSVNVTGTVDASITFAISDTAIGFGILDASNDCWANASPPTTCDLTTEAAHTLSIGTNATDGWAITYNGATLTSGTDTITVADINGDPDGTPGTEQFAIGASTNGDSTVTTDYDQASNNFRFIASTTTTFISEIVPTATETVSMWYIANIASNTEAGIYSTDITYIATATF